MPHLGPLSWVFIPLFFWLFLSLVMVGFWWFSFSKFSFILEKSSVFQNSNFGVFVWGW